MAKQPQDTMLGRRIAGRFQILERIGSGGMGVVYRARQELVDRDVAIKVLKSERADDSDAALQFLREAKAVSRLSSPHTVTLIDVGRLPRRPDGQTSGWFLAMELLEGSTLHDKLSRGALAVADAIRIADQLALSLGEAHAVGIVHRDLKPLNIFLADTPGHAQVVKVLDFGLATLSHGEDTSSPSRGGTPRYMAPESIAGGRSNPRADIYALGLILYEMLKGRHPFEELRGDELLKAQLETVAPPLSEQRGRMIPQALVSLVERCLAKSPQLRPRDGSAFRASLREAVGLPEDGPRHDPSGAPQQLGVEQDTRATIPSTLSLSQLRQPGSRRSPIALASLLVGLLTSAGLLYAAVEGSSVKTQEHDTPSPAMLVSAQASKAPTLDTSAPTVASAVPAAAGRRRASILFHSIPDGASVIVDGIEHGETPVSVSLEFAVPVQVQLSLLGHISAKILVVPSRDTRIRHVFQSRRQAAPKVDPVSRKVDHYLD